MIQKLIHEITLADLQALVGVVREDRTLEFKREMPGKAESELGPFLAGISSLANTNGGDFVIGIAANDGLAEATPGIAIASLDAEKLRIEQLVANGLEPRLPSIDIVGIETTVGCYVIVVRVRRSWVGPHRVKANSRFYGRNSAGKYPLDVGELRTAFVLGEFVADRMRAFRTDRLIRIGLDATPVRLSPGGRVCPSMCCRSRNLLIAVTTTSSRLSAPARSRRRRCR